MRRDYSSTAMFRHKNAMHRSLHPSSKDGLKMWALFLARYNAYFNIAKTVLFEQLVQPHFAKAQPVVRVKFSRFFETVTEQIEHDYSPIFLQNAMRRFDRALRPNGVMQSLT